MFLNQFGNNCCGGSPGGGSLTTCGVDIGSSVIYLPARDLTFTWYWNNAAKTIFGPFTTTLVYSAPSTWSQFPFAGTYAQLPTSDCVTAVDGNCFYSFSGTCSFGSGFQLFFATAPTSTGGSGGSSYILLATSGSPTPFSIQYGTPGVPSSGVGSGFSSGVLS